MTPDTNAPGVPLREVDEGFFAMLEGSPTMAENATFRTEIVLQRKLVFAASLEEFKLEIPCLDIDVGDDIAMLRDTVRAFVRAEIAPRAAIIDRETCSRLSSGAS